MQHLVFSSEEVTDDETKEIIQLTILMQLEIWARVLDDYDEPPFQRGELCLSSGNLTSLTNMLLLRESNDSDDSKPGCWCM